MFKKFTLCAVAALVLASCSTDPRSMKLSEIQELPEAERKEIMRELNGEEMAYVTRAMVAMAMVDKASQEKMMEYTLQEIIDKGKAEDK